MSDYTNNINFRLINGHTAYYHARVDGNHVVSFNFRAISHLTVSSNSEL